MAVRRSAAEYLARTLDAYGVMSVFFVPTILSRTLYELEQHTGIKRILTHGEKAAVYMADGYARASKRPGVSFAQNVGAANLAAGLRDPYLACSPVVAFTGGPYPHTRGGRYYQEIEDFPLFKPVTRESVQVLEGRQLPRLLDRVFRTAVGGRPGPVHLELAGHFGELVELDEIEADIPECDPFTVPRYRPAAHQQDIAAAVNLLSQAHRPVIVAGGGVRWSGAETQLLAFAEAMRIPIATSMNAKAAVPAGHSLSIGVPGLYSRQSANETIREADLVIFVGSQTGSQVTFNWQVPASVAAVIEINTSADDLGRHYSNGVSILADARTALDQLLDAATAVPMPDRAPWCARSRELAARCRNCYAGVLASDEVPIRPERLCAELTEQLPSDAVVLSDTGHAGMWTAAFLDLTQPDQDYLRAAGSLGWGLPAAIGAQLALPHRPTVLFTGDGGLWYHVAELETAARWQIPVVIVVNNNAALNQEIGPYTKAYGGRLTGRHAELWQFDDVDLAAMGETMGVRGISVKKPAEFAGALEEAVQDPGPVLLDVRTQVEALAPRAGLEQSG